MSRGLILIAALLLFGCQDGAAELMAFKCLDEGGEEVAWGCVDVSIRASVQCGLGDRLVWMDGPDANGCGESLIDRTQSISAEGGGDE